MSTTHSTAATAHHGHGAKEVSLCRHGLSKPEHLKNCQILALG